MPRREIENCRAIITGASSGIGRALARALAKEHAQLVLVARRENRLKALAGELSTDGAKCEITVGDITSHEVRQACINQAVQAFGGLDLLVNNAGIGAWGYFADSDEATLRSVMEVNFFALTELTRLAIPHLQEAKQPAIVNIGSIIGHHGLPAMSEYSASKGAVRGFTESLRAELIDRVHVMLVSPATTATEFFDARSRNRASEGAEVKSKGRSRWRAKKPLSAEAVAAATLAGVRKGRREVFPGVTPKLIRLVSRFFPWLVERMVEAGERKS
ncbi:MAG: SDR family oxidoreductase [Pirellulales bacterium]|nr:SDR family oxidoreductase [Pirellulales bacterium]